MHAEKFIASVQYGDFKGSAAADGADRGDAGAWLTSNGLRQEGEFLLGITLYIGENHGKHEDPVYAEFLLASAGDHDNVQAMIDANAGPILVRRVKREIPLTEFFGLFKRFSVHLSSHGMLEGKDYTYVEY
jgi:hypothetical protein